MKVLCVGHCTYDLICDVDALPVENSKIHYQVNTSCGGGSASNGACLLGKYGIETYLSSIIGDDSYGNIIKKELQSYNVNIENVETSYDASTDLSIILKNKANGSRTILGISKNKLIKQKNEYNIVPDYILADSYDYNATLSAFNAFPNAIAVIDVDNYNNVSVEMCKRATYIIASKNFAESVSGQKIDSKNPKNIVNIYSQMLSKFPQKKIIVTLEDAGALFLADNQIKIIPALKVETVDTTGAGDLFRAAFIYALIQNFDLEKSVTFAVIASGLSVTKPGGRLSIPDLALVMDKYNKKFGVTNDSNQKQPNT